MTDSVELSAHLEDQSLPHLPGWCNRPLDATATLQQQNISRSTMDRPSGSELPLLLRRRLEEQQSSGLLPPDHESSGLSLSDNVQQVTKQLQPYSPSSDEKNRIFTADELEERIWKTTVAMVEVQKQIHKGEETYVVIMCQSVVMRVFLSHKCPDLFVPKPYFPHFLWAQQLLRRDVLPR